MKRVKKRLKAIAENMPLVYEAGMAQGGGDTEAAYNEGFEAGYKKGKAETETKRVSFGNGETIDVVNNTIYTANAPIDNLTVNYPEDEFICSLNFTVAATGSVTITLPQSEYIGGVPSLANGETWELNISDGVVVGGKVT